MYPSFNHIKKILANDYQLVCLKENWTVITIGNQIDSQQVVTWNEIADVYVQEKAIYAIRTDGTVIYVGESAYDGAEYLYSWENVIEKGKSHLIINVTLIWLLDSLKICRELHRGSWSSLRIINLIWAQERVSWMAGPQVLGYLLLHHSLYMS